MNSKILVGLFAIILSILGGFAAVAYVSLTGGKILLLVALPLALVLGMFLLLDKRTLFLLIMIFRASGDVLFSTAKFGGSFGVGALANILIILIAILYVVERPSEFPVKALYMWLPVGVIAFFAALYSPDIGEAIRLFYILTTYFSIFVIAFYLVKTKSDYEYWVNVILLSSLLPVAYAFIDLALHTGRERYQSTFGHPNIFAFYLVLIISLVFYKIKSLTLKTTLRQKMIYFVYIAILVVFLLLTQTRSAWVAVFIIFAAYGLLIERRYLVYIGLGLFLALLIPSIRDRVLDLSEGNNQYAMYAKLNSYAWRKLLWESGLKWMEPLHYLYGYGLESFKYYSRTFFSLAGPVKWGAHSVFVQWIFETGALGMATLSWAYFRIFSTIKQGIKFDKTGAVITLLLLSGYLLESYSDNMLSYLSFNWYFWFFIGLSCALVSILQQQAANKSIDGDADSEPQNSNKKISY